MILGLTRHDQEPPVKRLFSYSKINGEPTESQHKALTPYLFDAGTVADRHLVVKEANRALSDVPKLVIGSKPIDGGHYIFNRKERDEFLRREPRAERYFRPFVGSVEFINGHERWILALDDAPAGELRAMPAVMDRIAAVKTYRLCSTSLPTQQLANFPTRYHVTVIPNRPFLVIPEASSERREYVPIGWLEPPTIPSNLVRVLLVYNTFPWPHVTETQKAKVRIRAQAVLDARAKFTGATLADLYDANLMKPELRRAHRALDAEVDKIYRAAPFGTDRERVEHLFGLYEQLLAPLAAQPKREKRRRAPQGDTVLSVTFHGSPQQPLEHE